MSVLHPLPPSEQAEASLGAPCPETRSGARAGDGGRTWKAVRAKALRLAADARRADPRVLEALRLDDEGHRVQVAAARLLERAIRFLDEVVSACGVTSGRRPPANRTFKGAAEFAVLKGFELGDIAEFLRVELRRRQAQLASTAVPRAVLVLESAGAISGVAIAAAAVARATSQLLETGLPAAQRLTWPEEAAGEAEPFE